MAISDLVQKGVDLALKVTDSLLVDVTVKRLSPMQYDVANDVMGGTEQSFTCRGLEYKLNDYEKVSLYPKVPKAGFDTKKVLISKTDATFEPELSDKVEIDGIEYAIISIQTPPSKPMFTLYITRGE